MYKYEIHTIETIDLDDVLNILGCGMSLSCRETEFVHDLKYELGDAAYKWVCDTLKEAVDNIKAREPVPLKK